MADYGSALSLSRDQSLTSDDSSSDQSQRNVPLSSSSKHMKKSSSSSSHHDNYHHHHPTAAAASLEMAAQKKPRGRPPGSKNKPKPPIIITKDTDSAMKPAVLEISHGLDIVHSIMEFAERNHCGISVISATGSVSNVTLRHPLSHAPSLSFHGPFNLISLTGLYIGSKPSSSSSSSVVGSSCFGISLAGAQGQVFGGVIAGKVLAATTVVVVVATFFNPTFHRLSNDHQNDDDHEGEEIKPGNGGGGAATGNISMAGYGGVANPTPINQMSPLPPPPPPHIMQWPGPSSRPHY